MSISRIHPLARTAAGVLAGTLSLTGAAFVAASPASALPGFTFERLAGDDRYATAAAIAAETFPTGSPFAVLARGDVFADALTSTYLAGTGPAPVLLTDSEDLPAPTSAALASLEVEEIIIVGGIDAVSQDVEDDLEAAGYDVFRLAGDDRYLTAALVAYAASAPEDEGDPFEIGELNGLRTAILGNGQDFADVLAAGPISYARNHPLLITLPTALPASTAGLLSDDDLDIEQVVIVGGTDAVSLAVEAEVARLTGNPVVRVAGGNRYSTAVEIAEVAYDSFDFDRSHVNLARGDDAADALAGGPHGGTDLAPTVLTRPDELRAETQAFLEENCPTLTDGHLFGGTTAISPTVKTAAETAAASCTAPGPVASFSITEVDAQDNNDVTANPESTTADNRTFNITGLTAGDTLRVTLVQCANVVGSGTDATFLAGAAEGSVTGFAAVTGAPTTDITSVNGEARMDSDTTTAGFQSGTTTFVASGTTATFTIDGDAAECVVPVVYYNDDTQDATEGGNIPRLEVAGPADSFGAPVEEFFVGGRTTFSAFVDNETLTVDPQTAATFVAVANPDGVATDDRTFTATGLDDDVQYRVTLVVCDNVTRNDRDQAEFASTDSESTGGNTDSLASTGMPTTDIRTVNGAPAENNTGAGMTTTANTAGSSPSAVAFPVDGTITFSIDGDQAECVVPVVYENGAPGRSNADGGTSPRLELDAQDRPIESFGVGGETTFTAAPVADTTPPTFVSATVAGGSNTLVLGYSELLDCSTVSAGDFSGTFVTSTGTVPIAPTTAVCTDGSASDNSVTLTFPGTPFQTGDSGQIDIVNGQIVSDVAGNDQLDSDSQPYTAT